VKNEKGFALVLTLVITALMVAVTTELIHQVYVDTALSRSFRDGQQASLLAESGVTGGLKYLQVTLSSSQTYSLPGAPLKQDDETGSIEITWTEESGKINLNDLVYQNGAKNTDVEKMLKRLGKQLNIRDTVWNALVDWLDADDLPTSSGGAETSYYKTLKQPYSARNGKLATVTELSLVRGFTSDVVAKLQPFVTVYSLQAGGRAKININTAPKEVIMALDDQISDSMAERVLEERRLHPFKSVSELSNISGFSTLSVGLQRFTTTRGEVFRIISIARVKDSVRTVEAVVPLTGTGEYLSWQEY